MYNNIISVAGVPVVHLLDNESYYEHRGVSCRKQVVQFHSQSKENMQQLRSLREQLETVIAVMHEFLENGLQKRTRSRSVDHATN